MRLHLPLNTQHRYLRRRTSAAALRPPAAVPGNADSLPSKQLKFAGTDSMVTGNSEMRDPLCKRNTLQPSNEMPASEAPEPAAHGRSAAAAAEQAAQPPADGTAGSGSNVTASAAAPPRSSSSRQLEQPGAAGSARGDHECASTKEDMQPVSCQAPAAENEAQVRRQEGAVNGMPQAVRGGVDADGKAAPAANNLVGARAPFSDAANVLPMHQ